MWSRRREGRAAGPASVAATREADPLDLVDLEDLVQSPQLVTVLHGRQKNLLRVPGCVGKDRNQRPYNQAWFASSQPCLVAGQKWLIGVQDQLQCWLSRGTSCCERLSRQACCGHVGCTASPCAHHGQSRWGCQCCPGWEKRSRQRSPHRWAASQLHHRRNSNGLFMREARELHKPQNGYWQPV